jgi:hypothetical protein
MTLLSDYAAHGWVLVPIASGKKGPTGKAWNLRERCVVSPTWRGNIGLAHAYSGTCAIDIDDLDKASAYLQSHGIDLSALLNAPDAVMISSGRPNRAKLLYRLVEPLESHKIVEKINGEPHSVIDFRCGNSKGTTVQDVLPPSIHPDTEKPYEWRYGDDLVGDWRSLPEIPAPLVALWRSLIVSPTSSDAVVDAEYETMTVDELRPLLYQHDPDCDRDTWVERMSPVHLHTRGSVEGLDLCVEWSSQGIKFAGRADVERVWRSFGLTGSRMKTAASLRVDEPATADDFDVIPEQPASKSQLAVAPGKLPALNFATDEDGFIFSSKENLHLALSRHDWCGTPIVLDEFRDDILVRNPPRPLTDTDYERLGIWLEFNGFRTIAHENMRRAVALVADDNRVDSARDWLESLMWDGTPRVEHFLADYFSAVDTPYTRAVSLYWWTAHAGRVLEPGCKADMVPILVGDQGVGKSTGVAAIAPAPENFVDVRLDHEDEEIARRIRGCLVGEIGELRGLSSRDAESIKQLITMTHDTWTPKYVERAHTVPRRIVFVGTTNSDEFLADETGNRRWLPVRVSTVRVQAIRDDRLQLWAEARDLWRVSGVAFGDAERLAKGEHATYMVSDVWDENITRWLEGGHLDDLGGKSPPRTVPFTLAECLISALGIESKAITKAHEMRTSRILRRLGCVRKQVRRGSEKAWMWDRVLTCPRQEI